MNVKIYLYSRCSTCRKAEQFLKDHHLEYERIEIKDTPPDVRELKRLHSLSGLDLRRFFNTSGQKYRELGLKDKLPSMSEDEKYRLLASDGMLIRRPLTICGDRVLLGFREEEFHKLLDSQ